MEDGQHESFAVENADGRAPVVILVDHASNAMPRPWTDPGISDADRLAHISWDPGALDVARRMAAALDAPLLRGTVSRLILDLNRPVTSATLIPTLSETTPIPGNVTLDEDERGARIARIHAPYHDAADALVTEQAARQRGAPIAVIAIHTFTPVFKGVRRPLEIGVLFDRDPRLGRAMLDWLSGRGPLKVAANEPYSPADEVYYTLTRHADANGHLNVMIEIRNDLVADDAGRDRIADLLTAALNAAMSDLAVAG